MEVSRNNVAYSFKEEDWNRVFKKVVPSPEPVEVKNKDFKDCATLNRG